MLFDAFRRTDTGAHYLAGRVVDGRYWWLRVGLFTGLLAFVVNTPSFEYGPADVLTTLRGQIEAPFTPQEHLPDSHASKRELRLTMPLLGHVLGLELWHLFVLLFVSGFVLLSLVALLTDQVFGDRTTAFFFAAGLACAPPGSACFTDMVGYFDGIAHLLLLLAMWTRAWPIVGLCVLAAAFTDERGAVAIGFVFLWWVYRAVEATDAKERGAAYGRAAAAVVGALLYGGLRLWVQNQYGLSTPVGKGALVGLGVWGEYRQWIPLGLLSGLEAFWILIGVSMWALYRRQRLWFLVMFGGMVVVQSAVAASVTDYTRSAAYLLPALLVALLSLRDAMTTRERRLFFLGLVLSCLLLPTVNMISSVPFWRGPLPLRMADWAMQLWAMV
ncbi:MAG: hypothetical protein WBA12_01200 [Catalinimonas sp.]